MHPGRLKSKATTSILRHYPKCNAYLLFKRRVSEATLSGFVDNNQQAQLRQTVTKAMIEEEVLKYVISGNIPFTQVENEHFRKLISCIQVNNHPTTAPSRKVIRSRLSVQSELAKENLKNILKANSSKISLALDCWSTRTNYGFLGT
jgi:hypothetical protein